MDINVSNNYSKVMTLGEIAYTQDGVLVRGREAIAVMIADETELEALAGEVNPGSVAFTAGFKAAWQLKADGEWEQWLGEAEGE